MKPLNQIKTEEELNEWFKEKAKRIDANFIFTFELFYKERRKLEEKYRNKLALLIIKK